MALLIISPLSRVKIVVVAPPRKVPRPVKLDTPETVSAPVRAIVPSVALVIVSPFKSVMEVVEATPSSWITPLVPLLITSPLSKVSIVVVAPPRKVAKPLVVMAPAEVVVALPPTHKALLAETLVVEALAKVVSPVTSRVEYKVAAPVAINVVDALKEPSNQDIPSNSDCPSMSKLSSAKAVICPPRDPVPILAPEVTVKSVPTVAAAPVVTAPVKVLVSVTVKVPPVLILVLIVVAAKVTAKTKTNDTNTDKAMEKILLLFINYLN